MAGAKTLVAVAVLLVCLSIEARSGEYSITALGTLSDYTEGSLATAINGHSQVVGVSYKVVEDAYGNYSFYDHAFLWNSGLMIGLGTLGGDNSYASGINSLQQVVGQSNTVAGDKHAFLWQNGQMRDLGTLGGTYSSASDINDVGQVVGISKNGEGFYRAFLWQDDQMVDLGTLGGTSSHANAINSFGQIVGASYTETGEWHACMWEYDGLTEAWRITDLQTLGGTSSSAYDINDNHQVVGSSQTNSGESHACIWQGLTATDLGTRDIGNLSSIEGIEAMSTARAINSQGEVVGDSWAEGPNTRYGLLGGDATLWENGTITAAYDLLPDEQKYPNEPSWAWLMDASDINDFGQIVGNGSFPCHGGTQHYQCAFLMTPVPEPATLFVLTFGAFALLRRRRP